ncbi:putative lipid II flippase FtsW [Arthrobacter psychrolactophilus]
MESTAKAASPSSKSSTAAGKKAAAAPLAPAKESKGWRRILGRINARAGRPSASYYWIIATTVALTSIGLMTVLSASAAESISAGADPYGLFVRAAIFAAIGLVVMMALSFVGAAGLKKIGWLAIILAVILLMAVVFTPLGKEVGGNRNWIFFTESLSFQPSEAAKLALALWMGVVMSRKGKLVSQWRHTIVPVVPVGIILVALILKGNDLGTAVILMCVLGAGLFFGGGSKRVLIISVLAGAVAAVILAAVSGNRTARLSGWLGNCNDTDGLCDQAQNGLYALASGGWFGVGLGQSRQKWSWIPEAHNDFIFAIIGEEFGLLGTIVILALYGVLAFAIFTVVMKRNDTFARVVCGSILAWVIGQAVVNIAMVTGLLPVIGVPLPMISYGGSSLVMVLAAIGIVLSFARTDPKTVVIKESTKSS